jgi:hypothetical protein
VGGEEGVSGSRGSSGIPSPSRTLVFDLVFEGLFFGEVSGDIGESESGSYACVGAGVME